jgi:chemotaxis protein methyltransferase CheR
MLVISDIEYQRFQKFLEQACGIVLGEGKEYLIRSRLTRLMRDESLDSLGDLVKAIERGSPAHLRTTVVDAMTTNETSWFRDGLPFETFNHILLPEYDKTHAGKKIRIWSAACSSGQEPFTLSMILSEYARAVSGTGLGNSQIIATDISPSMLAQAEQGIYEEPAVLRGLSEERRKAFFTQKGEAWQVDQAIRSRVSFKAQNLLQSFSALGKFDVIFCRNVLIYFSKESKQDILNRMAGQLNPGGYLFLGASETIIGYSNAFELIRTQYSPVYRLKS